MKILDKVKLPDGLKSLNNDELIVLSEDLREVITEYTLSANGGLIAKLLTLRRRRISA